MSDHDAVILQTRFEISDYPLNPNGGEIDSWCTRDHILELAAIDDTIART